MSRRIRGQGELSKIQGLSFSAQPASPASRTVSSNDSVQYNLRSKSNSASRKKVPLPPARDQRSLPSASALALPTNDGLPDIQKTTLVSSKGKRKRESNGKRDRRQRQRVTKNSHTSTSSNLWRSEKKKGKEGQRRESSPRDAPSPRHFPLKKLDSELPFHLITAEMLKSNRFYQIYKNQDASSLPTRDGRNLIHSETFADFDVPPSKWNDDHVLALRAIPFEDLSLHQMFPSTVLELDDEEKEFIDRAGDASLEEVETSSFWRLISAPDHHFGKFFGTLSGYLQTGHMREPLQRVDFVGSFIEPVLSRIALPRASTSELLTFGAHFPGCCIGPGRNDPTRLSGPSGWNATPFGFLHFEPEGSDGHSLDCNPPVAHLAFERPFSFSKYKNWRFCRRAALEATKDPSPSEFKKGLLNFLPQHDFVSCHLQGNKTPSSTTYARDTGLMMDQVHRALRNGLGGSQEAFVIGFSWTRFRISVGFFPNDLLQEPALEQPSFSTKSFAYILQSQEYDVATPDGRKMAIWAILALLKYLVSPKAKIAGDI